MLKHQCLYTCTHVLYCVRMHMLITQLKWFYGQKEIATKTN